MYLDGGIYLNLCFNKKKKNKKKNALHNKDTLPDTNEL